MSLTYKSVAQISRKPESSSIKFSRRTFSPGYQLKNCMDDFPPLKVHFQEHFLTNNNINNNNEKCYDETRCNNNYYNQHQQSGPSSSSSTTNKSYSECLIPKKNRNSTLQKRENPHQVLCSSKLYNNSQTINFSEKIKNSELIELSNNNIAFKPQVYPSSSSSMENQKPINCITKTKSEEKFNPTIAENLINNIYHTSNGHHNVGIENFDAEFLKGNSSLISHETNNTFLPELSVNKIIEEPKCIKGRSVHTINSPNYLDQKNANFNFFSTLNNNPQTVLPVSPSESIFSNNWYLQKNLSNQFGFNKIFNKMTPIFEEGNMYAEIYGLPTVSTLGIFNNLTATDKPILKGKKDFKARFLPYRRENNNVQNNQM